MSTIEPTAPRVTYNVDLDFGEYSKTRAVYNGETIAHSFMPIKDAAVFLSQNGGAENDLLVCWRFGAQCARHPLRTAASWRSEAERKPVEPKQAKIFTFSPRHFEPTRDNRRDRGARRERAREFAEAVS
jgi:hypothetical protein